jgi:hypothetical protein
MARVGRWGWWSITAAVGLMLLTAVRISAQSCPPPYTATFNVNEVGCTFCARADLTECKIACLGPPACLCPEDSTFEECCQNTPCCDNCPDPKPLVCSLSKCLCEPESCCFTQCPRLPAPALGSPGSYSFALVAGGLGISGLLLARRARRRG